MSNKTYPDFIRIKGAREHNLKDIELNIPLNCFTTVTGVSGSGKSSLVFDTLFRESRSRFIKATAGFSSKAAGKLVKADVDSIDGLPAAISLSQLQRVNSSRSTVGTLSEVYDLLRLLYARFGINREADTKRSLFSFNSSDGACPVCKGLGVVEKLSEDLLIGDETLSIKNGCFRITNSGGYIMYSQVTPDVLGDICESEGFSIDTPWNRLTDENKRVIFYGSNKIKVPFGKHSLESRMKWTGITAKPREEGYYKGIIPVMEEILKRDRNPNILKYTESHVCPDCDGKRLGKKALEVKYMGMDIGCMSRLTIEEIEKDFLKSQPDSSAEREIVDRIVTITGMIRKLGMGYLVLERSSASLGGGEVRVLRLVNQVVSGIRGILYLFDEPTTGLHQVNIEELNRVIRTLVDAGNSVVAVTHDAGTILSSDYVIEVGPGAGNSGGDIVFSGSVQKFLNNQSLTAEYVRNVVNKPVTAIPEEMEEFIVRGCNLNNLNNIDVRFRKNRINAVTGIPGAGKTSLLENIAGNGGFNDSAQDVHKTLFIDKTPIGKSPRSNPATYTGLFTHIRDIFAALPAAKDKGFKKGTFSFNVKGGRCDHCEGAGVITIGMHFLGNVEIECGECRGIRFKPEVLEILYRDKNIAEVLDLSYDEAAFFFRGETVIEKHVDTVIELGLGYMKLGQPSTTLSGGEAQRIKLASELVKNGKNSSLYLFDEPCQGLHFHDIEVLLKAFRHLTDRGNTVVAAEYDLTFVRNCHWVVDLGPGAGSDGGRVVFTGTPEELEEYGDSFTSGGIRRLKYVSDNAGKFTAEVECSGKPICFEGVRTNNLKGLNVDIELNRTTAVTGVSGSGKSSLVFDTLFAEGYNRYLESYSPYMRSILGESRRPDVETVKGIVPAIGVGVRSRIGNPRATVGTVTGIYDLLRLMFSRVGETGGKPVYGTMSAGDFSFNSEYGACRKCKGLGFVEKCSSRRLITNQELSLLNGAMDGTKTGKFYGDPFGQYTAHLKAVGDTRGIDFSVPVSELSEEALEIAMYGTGSIIYRVSWKFKRKEREGEHNFEGAWPGFCYLVDEEYNRKRGRKSAEVMRPLIIEELCEECSGSGLRSEILNVKIMGKSIYDYASMELAELQSYFGTVKNSAVIETTGQEIVERCKLLLKLGLGYLSCSRRVKTLSAGETSRIIIASGTRGGLAGLLYLVDEPASGLHPQDYGNLTDVFEELNSDGNSVVIVEHDPWLIEQCHNVIQLGPEAGRRGGELVEYIKPDYTPSWSISEGKAKGVMYFNDCCAHNLKNIDVTVPFQEISVITGVSGSGKSSLLFDVIFNSLKTASPVNCTSTEQGNISGNVIDYRGSKKVSGSMPAIMAGVFDEIRVLFASTEIAKAESAGKSTFSLSSKGGRCDKCGGKGVVVSNLDFINEVKESCPVCNGMRYKPEILRCLYKNRSIKEVLDMDIEEAILFFADRKKITRNLNLLNEAGLGYLKMGQDSTTLSAGETGRLQLCSSILRGGSGTIYLMDEPFKGLHTDDCRSLMELFRKLCAKGNTIVMTEHNPWVVAASDYVIDLGPEGGDKGGEVVFQGTPVELMRCSDSATGRELKRRFSD